MTIHRYAHKRHLIRNAQRSRCAICGERFGSQPGTLEHVVPRSKGGKHAGNLLVSHLRCNQRRGDANPTGCMLILLDVVNARLGSGSRTHA